MQWVRWWVGAFCAWGFLCILYRAFCAVQACFAGGWGVASCTLATPSGHGGRL